ncbi:RCC1/BLIP-II [Ceraceosorus guamensis]|uniref:RCC1/BLIP-II n=1 Tax=Ceraceosorus guamensis TaxID=1522189 RepID=A0A316W6U2_9BASI|nr:RCC1/BLIP-II [Ceraceosorus guamensis]PWN45597.1 RCC1/BLIP-II [Ceraceosorus guamensis]
MEQGYCLLTAGSNSGGQLGIGHRDDAHCWTPASTSRTHLGSGGTSFDTFPPPGYRITKLSSGANHSIALVQPIDGLSGFFTVWCTGETVQGQLGQAALELGEVRTRWMPLCLEQEVRTANRGLGNGKDGVNAHVLSAQASSALDVACSWNASFIVLRASRSADLASPVHSDVILALGTPKDNAFGELGLSDKSDAAPDSEHAARILNLGGLVHTGPLRIEQITAGLRHVVALASSHRSGIQYMHLIGWGAARHGQLGSFSATEPSNTQASASRPRTGSKSTTSSSPRTSTPRVIRTWCCKSKRKNDESKAPHGSFSLAAGREHTVVSVPAGWQEASDMTPPSEALRVRVWGSDRRGQRTVAQGDFCESVSLSVAATWDSTFLLCEGEGVDAGEDKMQILACGSNARGQLGSGQDEDASLTSSKKIQQVALPAHISSASEQSCEMSAGSEHVLLLCQARIRSEGRAGPAEVWAWGWNEHGNLALGSSTSPNTQLEGSVKSAVTQWAHARPTNVWAGCGTSFVQVELTKA